MPNSWQTQGRIEELAILARAVGASRITLYALEDDDAFTALCMMGASVHSKRTVTSDKEFRTERAHLRVHRVDVEVRRPIEECTASNDLRSRGVGGAKKLDGEEGRVKGHATGRRIVRLERDAAFDAKSRLPLPAFIELTQGNAWAPIDEAVSVARQLERSPTIETVNSEIDVELKRIDDAELTAKVATVREQNANDITTLIRILNRLKNK